MENDTRTYENHTFGKPFSLTESPIHKGSSQTNLVSARDYDLWAQDAVQKGLETESIIEELIQLRFYKTFPEPETRLHQQQVVTVVP